MSRSLPSSGEAQGRGAQPAPGDPFAPAGSLPGLLAKQSTSSWGLRQQLCMHGLLRGWQSEIRASSRGSGAGSVHASPQLRGWW